MYKDKQIRPLALALIKKEDKLLVFEAEDPIKQETYYRPLGGGIEFRETSIEAVSREIQEEIGAEIEVKKFLRVFENIFTHEGRKAHEIVFLYEVDFIDKQVYNKDNIPIKARKAGRLATWVEIKKLKKANFYPEGIKKLI